MYLTSLLTVTPHFAMILGLRGHPQCGIKYIICNFSLVYEVVCHLPNNITDKDYDGFIISATDNQTKASILKIWHKITGNISETDDKPSIKEGVVRVTSLK